MNHLLSQCRTLVSRVKLGIVIDFDKPGIFVNSRYCYRALCSVRGYQSRAGVYGHKPEETVEFSLPEDVIERRAAECNVFRFISAYREFGHLKADINPLQPNTRVVPELNPHLYGLRSDEVYNLKGLIAGCDKTCTLEQLQDILQQKYCGHIGAEFAYLPTLEEREWFATTLEAANEEVLTTKERIRLAEDMLRSQVFDNFLAVKFQSVKRYGGEGAESVAGFFTEAFKRLAQGCLLSLAGCWSAVCNDLPPQSVVLQPRPITADFHEFSRKESKQP